MRYRRRPGDSPPRDALANGLAQLRHAADRDCRIVLQAAEARALLARLGKAPS